MIPAAIAPKLAKLLPMLGSDNDGEVVSTVHAIRRTLSTAGVDLHDLAETLSRMRTIAAPRPASGTTKSGDESQSATWNYANEFRQAAPVGGDPEHPNAMTRKFGLPVFREGEVGSWSEVCRHCFTLNRSIPKKQGGRFLRDFEVALLNEIMTGQRWPTNANAAWIETVVARCHQARDRQQAEGRRG